MCIRTDPLVGFLKVCRTRHIYVSWSQMCSQLFLSVDVAVGSLDVLDRTASTTLHISVYFVIYRTKLGIEKKAH